MSSSLNAAVFLYIQKKVQEMVNKKAAKHITNEIEMIVANYGVEAENFLFKCLFMNIDFLDPKTQNGTRDKLKVQFLLHRLTKSYQNPRFIDYFSQVSRFPSVIEAVHKKFTIRDYFENINKCLKLPIHLQIVISLSLVLSSNETISQQGIEILQRKVREHFEMGMPFQFPDNVLSQLLYVMRSYPEFKDMSEEIKFLVESNCHAESYDLKALFVKNIESAHNIESKSLDSLLSVTLPAFSLSEIMRELGPSCTQNIQDFSSIISDFPQLDEAAILDVLVMIANEPSFVESSQIVNSVYLSIKDRTRTYNFSDDNNATELIWNIDNILEVISKTAPNINLPEVIKKLDRPRFDLKTSESLKRLFQIFHKLKRKFRFEFPSSILFERWRNANSQAQFLIFFMELSDPELCFLDNLSIRRVDLHGYTKLDLLSLRPTLKLFSFLDITEILIELSESRYFPEIRRLFELPLVEAPDLLLLVLIQCRPNAGKSFMDELYNNLLPAFISNQAGSKELLKIVWKTNPSLLISTFEGLYKKDRSANNLSGILDLTQEIKDSLMLTLRNSDHYFSLSLGILAAKKGLLNLEDWIDRKLKEIGDPFVKAILKYFEDNLFSTFKISSSTQNEDLFEQAHMKLESVVNIFQKLMAPSLESKISGKTRYLISQRYQVFCELFPNAVSKISWSEVEKISDSLFQRIFEEKLRIEDFVEMLGKYKSSASEKERKIFLCVMKNMLEESKFFAGYNKKMLINMGQLYGIAINNDFLQGQSRDAALKVIIESLKNKEDDKLLEFGIVALQLCKTRLYECPTQATQLFNIDNLKERYLNLLEEIRLHILSRNTKIELPQDYFVFLQMKNQERGQRELVGNVFPKGGHVRGFN